LVEFLVKQGAPLVNITIGNPYYNPHVNRPFDLPTAGAPVRTEAAAGRGGSFCADRAPYPSAPFPDLAVIGGGYSWLRQFLPHVAAANIRNGWVSLVGWAGWHLPIRLRAGAASHRAIGFAEGVRGLFPAVARSCATGAERVRAA